MKQRQKTALVWLLLILAFVLFWHMLNTPRTDADAIPFDKFLAEVDSHNVKDVSIAGREFTGTLRNTARKFKTIGVEVDYEFSRYLAKNDVIVTVEKDDSSSLWLGLVFNGLPMLFLLVIFFVFMRQLQNGGGKAMSFGKSKAKLLSEHTKKVTFADVAGINEAKQEVEEIIEFLKDPKKFTRLGGRIPKGVLMMGAPGTGKTLLARAIAGEAGVPFFSISGSDFVEMFVGVGASRVRDLFEQGKKNAPCIIFIDEIDAVGRQRGAGLGGGHDEREQTLNQLLVEMDGFEFNDGVILVAATNRPDVLDPALLRPGRFDRRIMVPRPDVRGRQGILDVHTGKTPLAPDMDLGVIAKGTPGFSGADLENLVNEAALAAARRDREYVTMEDFEAAKDKVLMGSARHSLVLSERERETTAVHEAGHTLVALLIPGEKDPIHKVSIIPRGASLGATQQLPDEDRLNLSAEYAENRIAIMMGGRLAEELVFNQLTTGAGNDIEQATELARRMVTEWGMSVKLGPLSFRRKEEAIFLGREFSQAKEVSEATSQVIDNEVSDLIMRNYDRARQLLADNLVVLRAIADALLEREVLDASEVDQLLGGGELPALPDPSQDNMTPGSEQPSLEQEPKSKKKLFDLGALTGGKLPEPEPGNA